MKGNVTSERPQCVATPRTVALVVALIITNVGDYVAYIIFALAVSDHATNSTWVSLLFLASMVPGALLAPLIGRVVDAAPAAPLLGALMLGQAVIVLAALWAPPPALVVIAALLGALGSTAITAVLAVAPRIASDRRLPAVISTIETCRSCGILLGPGLAALLLAHAGPKSGIVLDSASFAIAAAAAFVLPRSARAACDSSGRRTGAIGGWTPMVRGFQLLRADQLLRRVLPIVAVIVCASMMFNVALVFYVRLRLGMSESAYGLFVLMVGAGLAAGPSILGRTLGRQNPVRFGVACGGMVGIAMVGSVMTTLIPVIFAFLLAIGVANAGQNVALRTAVIRCAPENERGLAISSYLAIVQGAAGSGLLIAGLPAPSSSTTVIVLGGSMAAIAAAVGLVLIAPRGRLKEPSQSVHGSPTARELAQVRRFVRARS